ncbi:MAG: bacteriohemerythrin [Candidatus Delongbacteria bacterium]
MAFLDWNASLETGVPEMDRQHRRLVDLLNQLHAAMKAGRGAEQVQTILSGLVAYTNTHFQAEETLLRQKGWIGLNRHLILHADLLKQLNGYVSAFQQNQRISTLELADFLKSWLSKHIMQEDQQYGKALAG